jgi:FkbM family methyltransferase
MKCEQGVWFPDNEHHLVKMLKLSPTINGKGTYQHHKLDAAMRFVKHRRCAIDVGMHVGLWSMHLARLFQTVVGFEPAADHVECLHLNMSGFNNYQVHNCALGNRTASVGLKRFNGSTGSTQIEDDGQGIPMRRLDDFQFDAVDFIKIDVEYYEPFVVEGGEQTIRKHRPVVIVEQKGGTGKVGLPKHTYGKGPYAAKELLESWGAKQKFEISGDYCMSWR